MGQDPPEKGASKTRNFDAPEDYYDDGERGIDRVESAWAKAALYFRTGWHFGHEVGNMRGQSMIRIHEQIEVFRRRFEGGDTLALLHAIGICAEENLPLPTWLARAYKSALTGFLQPGGLPTLDAVFHSPSLPTDTPKKAAAARLDWQLGAKLWSEAWQVALSDETLQSLDAVVEEVLSRGKYGVRKTKARELVLMVENNQRELLGDPPSKHLSRFLEKRRKR